MPRRRRRIFRRGGDGGGSDGDYNYGDSVDDAADYDSAGGFESDRNGSEGGMNSGSEGISSDPTGNYSRFRLRRRKNKSVDDADLLNIPRRVGGKQSKAPSARPRLQSHDSVSYLGDPNELKSPNNKSKFKKIRQALNPFSGRKAHRSADDLDSLGLGSADEGINRRFRRGGGRRDPVMRAPSPSAFRNNDRNEPPIRNVSFDSGLPELSVAPTNSSAATSTDMLSAALGGYSSSNATTPRPKRSEGQRARYSVYHGSRGVKKKFRVRPYHVFNEPRYLTEEEIYADSTQPSVFYEFLKSYLYPSMKPSSAAPVPEEIRELFGTPAYDGRIGSLRVEVLGCVSLDRQKPDVCVYLVSGDSAFCTDVIQGYRSPMWPCQSRRAAVFPLHHAYTQLFVGVFDSRVRKNKENDVFCGRISIDIATLRPNTIYDITFPLRASTCVYDRRKRGVIRLRFSLHWFTERGAVMSYFKGPKSLLKTNPLLGGYPTIPCADPKTFRNVAYTVYGADLPGKYSRSSFRATVREFNLYHTNFRFIIKTLILDAIFYEKIYISLYLFFGGLYMIWMQAVSLVPAYCLTYVLILYGENYYYYVTRTDYNDGYRQLTAFEVFKGLIFNAMGKKSLAANFQPVLVPKRAKKRGVGKRQATSRNLKRLDSAESGNEDQAAEEEFANQDHKEFPFSERDAYPKLGVEDALAPSKDGGGTTRLHGRLSVYYQSPAVEENQGVANDGDDDSSGNSDDETVITTTGMGDTMFDMDNLEDEDEEEEVYDRYGDDPRRRRKSRSRVHLGTPQNNDVAGRKVPPQITMKKMEHLFHKMSWKVAYEQVAAPPLESEVAAAYAAGVKEKVNKDHEDLDEGEKAAAAALKRKYPMDEYDRLLALEFKSANPINRILASFLGPMMRMGRTVIYVIRIAFNATTWRDPFLSFWIFVALFSLLLLLIIFPWRAFFLFTTIVGLGPQNYLIRKFLERRAEKKERQKREAELLANATGSASSYGMFGSNASTSSGDSNRNRGGIGLFGISLGNRRTVPRRGKRPSIDNMEAMVGERPAFSSDLYGQSSSKKLPPRSVAIPYSRVRKERFYDWPPDPTVSRATPLDMFAPPPIEEETLDDLDSAIQDSEEFQYPPPPPPPSVPASPGVVQFASYADTAAEPEPEPEPEPEQTLRHRKFVDSEETQVNQANDQDYLAEYEAMGYG